MRVDVPMLLPPDLQLEEVGQDVLRGKNNNNLEKGMGTGAGCPTKNVLVNTWYELYTLHKQLRCNLS